MKTKNKDKAKKKVLKVLVVANDKSLGFITAKAISRIDCEAVVIPHKEALEKFFEEDPQVVIIWDYSEKYNGPGSEGCATYKDIKASASTKQKIIRIGFESYNHADYIKAPFDLNKFLTLLK